MQMACSGRCHSFVVTEAIAHLLIFGLSCSRMQSAVRFLLIPLTQYSSFCIQFLNFCSVVGGEVVLCILLEEAVCKVLVE